MTEEQPAPIEIASKILRSVFEDAEKAARQVTGSDNYLNAEFTLMIMKEALDNFGTELAEKSILRVEEEYNDEDNVLHKEPDFANCIAGFILLYQKQMKEFSPPGGYFDDRTWRDRCAEERKAQDSRPNVETGDPGLDAGWYWKR